MELEIGPPSCSGVEMVSQKCSSRARLDAATTSELLSAVTPGDCDIIGLGISLDLETSPAISNKSSNDGSMSNSKSKAHFTEVSNTLISTSKASSTAAVPSQIDHGSVSIARNGPPRWPSGVPGLGNTILGPRCPRISNVTCPPIITRRNSPILLPHTTSTVTIPLAPPSRKQSKATRTSTKRRASSPPSTGLSAKMARVSMCSTPVSSIPADPSVVKHDEKDQQAFKRFEPRRLGLPETEPRARAAKIWQIEKEKIKQQMESTQHSVQIRPELSDPDTVHEGRTEPVAFSPEEEKNVEYACDTTRNSTQRSVKQENEHEEAHRRCKDTKLPREAGRFQRKNPKLHEAASYAQLSQAAAPFHITNTRFRGHILFSTIKKSTPTTTSSNDKKRISSANQTNLTFLINDFLNLLEPYVHFHFSCSAVRPLHLIHASLLSSPPTVNTMEAALDDTRELLKVLAEHQIATLTKLEDMKEELEEVGKGSVAFEARERVMRTEGDVKKIEEWMGECKA